MNHDGPLVRHAIQLLFLAGCFFWGGGQIPMMMTIRIGMKQYETITYKDHGVSESLR